MAIEKLDKFCVKLVPIEFVLFVKQLDGNLAELTAQFERATADKLKCQQEAEATQLTISLANRLVGGLASENVRWAESVGEFKKQVLSHVMFSWGRNIEFLPFVRMKPCVEMFF